MVTETKLKRKRAILLEWVNFRLSNEDRKKKLHCVIQLINRIDSCKKQVTILSLYLLRIMYAKIEWKAVMYIFTKNH